MIGCDVTVTASTIYLFMLHHFTAKVNRFTAKTRPQKRARRFPRIVDN